MPDTKTLALCIALAFMAGAAAAQSWHRCVGADGKTVYSDRPCAGALPSPVAPRSPAAPPAAAPGRASAPQMAPMPAPTRIQFGGTPAQDYQKAESWLGSIRDMGANCRAALTAGREGASASCQRFLSMLRPGAEYEQIGWRLTVLNADEVNVRESRRELRAIQGHLDAIVLHKEFVLATLGVPR
jgi:Domain of unknown function (DUF4124)